MAITLKATNAKGANFTTSLAVAYSGSVTAGSLLVAFVFNNQAGQTNSVTDNINGAWTASASNNASTSVGVFYFPNSASGSITVTATLPTSTSSHLFISEFGGVATSTPLDVAGAASGFAGATPGVSITTTVNGDLIVGGMVLSNLALSVGSGFTQINTNTSGIWGDEYQIQSTAGSISVNFANGTSGSGTWTVVGASFKAAGGGGAGKLFLPSPLTGIGTGGPFFSNPIG